MSPNVPLRTAKLTDDEVLLLRARKARGEHVVVKDEADRFGCGIETIRKILRGDTFRHLLGPAPVTYAKATPVTALPTEEEMEMSLLRFLSEVKSESALEDPDADIAAILGYSEGNTPG